MVVLGGGPAGLALAERLARAGHRVTLLEAGAEPGGLARSLTVAGIRVDHGSHRLHPSTPPRVLAHLQALLGDELQLRPRRGRIRLQGRWLAFPLQPVDAVTHLPPRLALRVGVQLALAPTRRAASDTFAEVLRAGLGPALCDAFWFPYAHKVWGRPAQALSGEQARRRVATARPGALVRRLLRRSGPGPVFYYPRSGFGAIAEHLHTAAVRAGADVRLGTPVETVRIEPHGARVRGGGDELAADLVCSTVPLPTLGRVVEGAPPPPRRRLPMRAMVLVYLAVAARQVTSFDAHYLPEAWTPVTRFSEPRNYRDADDPGDRTVLCFELPCEVGDVSWESSEEQLRATALEALRGSGLTLPGPVVETLVRRLPSVYPVWEAGAEDVPRAWRDWAAALPHVVSLGRQGSFAHDNTHHALAQAWDLADAVGPDGRVDRVRWETARQRHAEHVVED